MAIDRIGGRPITAGNANKPLYSNSQKPVETESSFFSTAGQVFSGIGKSVFGIPQNREFGIDTVFQSVFQGPQSFVATAPSEDYDRQALDDSADQSPYDMFMEKEFQTGGYPRLEELLPLYENDLDEAEVRKDMILEELGQSDLPPSRKQQLEEDLRLEEVVIQNLKQGNKELADRIALEKEKESEAARVMVDSQYNSGGSAKLAEFQEIVRQKKSETEAKLKLLTAGLEQPNLTENGYQRLEANRQKYRRRLEFLRVIQKTADEKVQHEKAVEERVRAKQADRKKTSEEPAKADQSTLF